METIMQDTDHLGCVRAALDYLCDERSTVGLTKNQQADYEQLCDREFALLRRGPPLVDATTERVVGDESSRVLIDRGASPDGMVIVNSGGIAARMT
jgi:hypothetical protein